MVAEAVKLLCHKFCSRFHDPRLRGVVDTLKVGAAYYAYAPHQINVREKEQSIIRTTMVMISITSSFQ